VALVALGAALLASANASRRARIMGKGFAIAGAVGYAVSMLAS
jgi:hypothetical protein